ncbi:MAG: tetratricopeptide repeat protein, partial [Chloroflexi bacterium]
LGRKADARECYKRAKSLFESSGGINSNDPDLVSGLAFVLDELDLHSKALLAYDRVIAMRPGDLVALFNKALILDNSGRYADAEAAYRATLARFPDDPDCNAGLGHALGKLERYVEAEIYCRKALNKQETHSDAHEALGFALQSLGRYKDAELEYRASLGIAPNAPDTCPSPQRGGSTRGSAGIRCARARNEAHVAVPGDASGDRGQTRR